MTLTGPIPQTTDPARQRFELELLLQQPVPGPDQLQQGQLLMSKAHPDITPDQWRALQALPIAVDADHLDLAIPSQWREQEWQTLIDQLPQQTRTIRLHPVLESDLLNALNPEPPKPQAITEAPLTEDEQDSLDETAASFLEGFSTNDVLEGDPDDPDQIAKDAIDLESSLRDAEASPVVALVDRILLQAMSVSASDIHVEPQQKGLRLRYRQDGVLQQYIEPLPSRLIPAVTSRFKILADLDIAERRQAQDGRIRRK